MGTRGARRAVLGALLGSVMLATSQEITATSKSYRTGKHRGSRRAKRQSGAGVQAESKPEFVEPIHDEGTVPVAECDGFTILDQYVLDLSITKYFAKDGTLVKALQIASGTDTFINSETGRAITAPFHQAIHVDPPARLRAHMGIIFKVVVPGAGAIILDIGRIVFNIDTDDIVFQAGPHQVLGDGLENAVFDALCAALA